MKYPLCQPWLDVLKTVHVLKGTSDVYSGSTVATVWSQTATANWNRRPGDLEDLYSPGKWIWMLNRTPWNQVADFYCPWKSSKEGEVSCRRLSPCATRLLAPRPGFMPGSHRMAVCYGGDWNFEAWPLSIFMAVRQTLSVSRTPYQWNCPPSTCQNWCWAVTLLGLLDAMAFLLCRWDNENAAIPGRQIRDRCRALRDAQASNGVMAGCELWTAQRVTRIQCRSCQPINLQKTAIQGMLKSITKVLFAKPSLLTKSYIIWIAERRNVFVTLDSIKKLWASMI